MQKTKSRLLVVLVILFVLCLTLFAVFTVFGNQSVFAAGEHYDHLDGTWTEVTADIGTLEGSSGEEEPVKYYLKDNVTLTQDLQVNGYVELCLNGHILRGTGASSVIIVNQGAHFVLCDCDESDANEYYIEPSTNNFVLGSASGSMPFGQTGGIITGGGGNPANNQNGGGIYVSSGATFDFNGGAIAGNSIVGGGGGIFGDNNSVININGGELIGNRAINGGAIRSWGVVNVTSASISYNRAEPLEEEAQAGGAGAISIVNGTLNVGSKATGAAEGRVIINANYAKMQGGAIYVAGSATANLFDVMIMGNECPNGIGGVYADISTTVSVADMLTLTGNRGAGSGQYGPYLGNLQVASGKVNVAGALSNAEIYAAEGTTFVDYAKYNGAYPGEYIFAETDNNCVYLDGDNALVTQHEQDLNALYPEGGNIGDLPSGRYYLSADFKGYFSVPQGADVKLCLNGHKIQPGSISVGSILFNEYLTVNGSLEIYDCNGSRSENAYYVSDQEDSAADLYIFDDGTDEWDTAYASATEKGVIEGGVVNAAMLVYGTFSMTGGAVSGNSLTAITIDSDAEFYMRSGKIVGNAGIIGAVCVSGYFEMSGGSIEDNSRITSGAILLQNDGSRAVISGGHYTQQ